MPAYHPAEIHSLFRRAFNAGDVGSLVALYEPNAVLVVDGKNVIGRENICEVFEDLFARFECDIRQLAFWPDERVL